MSNTRPNSRHHFSNLSQSLLKKVKVLKKVNKVKVMPPTLKNLCDLTKHSFYSHSYHLICKHDIIFLVFLLDLTINYKLVKKGLVNLMNVVCPLLYLYYHHKPLLWLLSNSKPADVSPSAFILVIANACIAAPTSPSSTLS